MPGDTLPKPVTKTLPDGREVRAMVVQRRAPDDRLPRRYIDVQMFGRNGLGGVRGIGDPLAIRSDALRATIEALEEVERVLWT